MKNVLNYQTSEYDCGPTTLMNAIRFLFEREQIQPEIVKSIALYTLDAYNAEGEYGKSGTSRVAMMFLANWFNQFGKTKKFPIEATFLDTSHVNLSVTGRIQECLHQGGVVIVCCYLAGDRHYILLTGIKGEWVDVFDPYDFPDFPHTEGVELIENEPYVRNRSIHYTLFDKVEPTMYALGEIDIREAVLIFNSETRKTPEKTIEYFI